MLRNGSQIALLSKAQRLAAWASTQESRCRSSPRLHRRPISGNGSDQIVGRHGLGAWISSIRAAAPDLLFTTKVGPTDVLSRRRETTRFATRLRRPGSERD